MRKIFLLGVALIAITVAAACSGGGGGDSTPTPTATPTPTGTATPGGPFNITVDGTGWPHNGSNAYVRVLDTDSSNRVVLCQGPLLISGMSFTAGTNSVLTAGHHFKAESFVDLNTDNNFDPGSGATNDHDYCGSSGAVTGNTTITIAHGSTGDCLTWTTNTGCPGT